MTSDRGKCWGGDCVKRRRCNPLRLRFEPISDPRNAKKLGQAINRRWVGVLQRMQEVYIIWRSLGTPWRSPRDRGRSPGDLREISGRSPGDLGEMRLSLLLWKIFILERLRDISGRFPGDLREISTGISLGDLWDSRRSPAGCRQKSRSAWAARI